MGKIRDALAPVARKLTDACAFVGEWIHQNHLKAVKIAIVGVMLLLMVAVCSAVKAADATVSWVHPTTNVDGSAIPASGAGSLTGTRVEWGTCTNLVWATKVGESVVPAPAASYTIAGLAPGTYCTRAYSRNTYAVESAVSTITALSSKTVLPPVPNPPTGVAVAVIAGMLQTPVYSVAASGAMSTFVGFTDVDTQCSGPVLFTYRTKQFREVQRASVKLWGATSLRLAAPCVGV
jgi:hypothetical protein